MFQTVYIHMHVEGDPSELCHSVWYAVRKLESWGCVVVIQSNDTYRVAQKSENMSMIVDLMILNFSYLYF